MHSDYLDFETPKQPSSQTLVDEYISALLQVRGLEEKLAWAQKILAENSYQLANELSSEELDSVVVEYNEELYHIHVNIDEVQITKIEAMVKYPI